MVCGRVGLVSDFTDGPAVALDKKPGLAAGLLGYLGMLSR